MEAAIQRASALVQRDNQVKPGNKAFYKGGFVSGHMNDYRTVSLQTVPSGTFSTEGVELNFRIDEASIANCEGVTVEFDVKETGGSQSVTFLPVPMWFNFIQVLFNNGVNQEIQTIHPEAYLLWLASLNPSKQRALMKQLNMSDFFFTRNRPLPASGSHTFRMPLLLDFLSVNRPNLQHISGDTIIRFNVKSSVLASGSGTPSLNAARLVINSFKADAAYVAAEAKLYKSPIIKPFIRSIEVEEKSVTLTAGTEYKMNLKDLVGLCAGLIVMVRDANYTSASNQCMNWYDLGSGATLDIKSSSSESLLGGGTAVHADHFRNIVGPQVGLNGDLFDHCPVYYIPFHDSFQELHQGVINGAIRFSGENVYLCITPDNTAAVSEVVSLNCNNAANDAGYYAFNFDGYQTDEIVYSSDAATIKAAIEALPPFKEQNGMSVTASAALTADATLTFSKTSYKLRGPASERHGLIKVASTSLNDGGVPEFVSTSVTTNGVRGWTTGSYAVSVYALMHCNATIANGQVAWSDA